MSYVILARKYRPQNFEEIAAQDHISRTLKNSLVNDRLASGYLFCGPRGTGKTTTARILAKCVNCVNGPTETPCGECSACIEIAAGVSLDVLEIDAASNTGVDDVRTLKENVRYMPTSGKKRVFIIDEVHRLSGAAFDALLKTLEEPPPHVIFILATTEPMKVPETILSRTQRYDFKRVSQEDLTTHLKKIALLEKIEVSDAALSLIARKADGSVRDSLSLFDQIIAFAGTKISEQDVIEGLGLVHRQLLFDYTSAVKNNDSKKILGHIKEVFESGTDISDFISELIEHFRILLILATDKENRDLVNLSDSELEDYLNQAESFSVGDIIRLMKTIADMHSDIKFGLDERMVIELASIKMTNMESTVKLQDVLNSLDKLSSGQTMTTDLFPRTEKKKREDSNLKIASPQATPASPLSQTNPQEKTIEAKQQVAMRNITLSEIQSEWGGFIKELGKKSQLMSNNLKVTELSSFEDNTLKIIFGASGEFAFDMLNKTENMKMVSDNMTDYFNSTIRLDLILDKTRETASLNSSVQINREFDVKKLLENSPRLKELLGKVDGEIIGIRKNK